MAHHGSNVSYQTDQTITIAATVTEWEFINPHAQIYFDVKNETGEIAHWAAELLPTPSMMRNMKVGWTRTTLKPGDQIVLVCNPPCARIAADNHVGVEIQNHPLMDGFAARLEQLKRRGAQDPHPFVISDSAYGAFLNVM